MDIFDKKDISPMLISEMRDSFDSPDYIFELKLDGERCIAYLDKTCTLLQNKRHFNLNLRFPELTDMNKAVKTKCILDGEITILKNGKPDFSEIQRRSLMSNKFKVELAASKYPASFTAFDILYYDGRQITDLPLMERKKLLKKAVNENSKISVSRYIENDGKAFYKLTEKNDLEGIVAKRKDSKYYIGKRTKDWIKIKNLKDDDYIICGYIKRENGVASLILGQYSGEKIEYKGHVIISLLSEDFRRIENTEKAENSAFLVMDNDNVIWIKPALTCTVKYMEKTKSGGLRQPVFKCLRDDKAPEECTVK